MALPSQCLQKRPYPPYACLALPPVELAVACPLLTMGGADRPGADV